MKIKVTHISKKTGAKFFKISVPFFIGKDEIEKTILQDLDFNPDEYNEEPTEKEKTKMKTRVGEVLKIRLQQSGDIQFEGFDYAYFEPEMIEKAEKLSKLLFPEFY